MHGRKANGSSLSRRGSRLAPLEGQRACFLVSSLGQTNLRPPQSGLQLQKKKIVDVRQECSNNST
jgi:hypothetical protein